MYPPHVSIASGIRGAASRLGIDLGRLSDTQAARRVKLIAHHRIDVVIDVGANMGQFGGEMRRLGFAGRIISLEPVSTPYRVLAKRCARDPRWECWPWALGAEQGFASINVAGNAAMSSSLLDMTSAHRSAAPEADFVGSENIQVRRLDTVWGELGLTDSTPYLKLDVQGYERHVLEGAGSRLQDIVGLQVELSLTQVYEGAPVFLDMLTLLSEQGFVLMSIESGFTDRRTGRMLQADGVFFRA